ncbi:MAG TPA: AraC family transcriptional regulator [Candidatus Caccousia avistercoris]|nr:AraC family transcriptional regulator [Candidatus Caccousia avistercoris]
MGYISDSFKQDLPSGLGVSVDQCGWQLSGAGHSCGPAVREHYVIHYIVKGRGTYTAEGRSWELSQGDGFFIWPGVSTYYEADKEEPWEYYWFGFYGPEAQALLSRTGLSSEHPVYHNEDPRLAGYLRDMHAASKRLESAGSRDLAMIGCLYLFFSCFCPPKGSMPSQADQYVSQAMQFIENNYAYPIGVADVAEAVGLERSYLHRLFRSRVGQPVGRCILEYRLARARDMLEKTDFSVSEVAFSTGFCDASYFSNVFQKHMELSPTQYRKKRGGS